MRSIAGFFGVKAMAGLLALALIHTAALAADGKSGFRFVGSSEFSELPTKSERWNNSNGPGDWAYWRGRSLQLEVLYGGTAPDGYIMRTYLHVEAMLPTSFKWLQDHRSSIVWAPDTTEMTGSKGSVDVRTFTINDGTDHHCAGFLGAWGVLGSGAKHVVAGFICSASSTFPLDQVLSKHLYALALDGKFDHFLTAP